MRLRYLLATSVLGLSATAQAQSTGSVDFEESVIVVSSSILRSGVEGIVVPDTTKAKQVLTQDQLSRNNPGQTVLDSINIIPGVTFTNNDAYGSAGGQLSIRGFSSDRISLTFDGLPLNDSGNYAIYSNQQIDPELIDQVNVNLGSTDVDSPTAAASGSTVNYRTRNPDQKLGFRLSGSAGEYNYTRLFGMIDTGEFTSFGTSAFVSASKTDHDNPYNNYGKIDKLQVNGKIYQPLGNSGDFISVAGHYNENRNNFFGSVPLRLDADRVVGGGSGNRFPLNKGEREYQIALCPVNTFATPGTPGAADMPTGCATEFDRRYNPSNTGNIRGASRFSLTDTLTLTVDPSYQYVKANGGGTVNARERQQSGLSGYIGGRPYFGMDLNGDGDLMDEVTLLAPSQTQTQRFGTIANLRWDFSEDHSARIAYTLDHARHRQTGEVGQLHPDGEPFDVFPVNDPLSDVTGAVLQKRDRLSYAILHQVSGEYSGSFFDDALRVTGGVRAPFFKRDLNNYCFTTSDTGFVDCFGKDDPRNATYANANPDVQGPQQRILKYDKILPSAGLIFSPAERFSIFANFSKGLQVPSTDNLYNAFFFPADTASARPEPETTDNFDLGLRYATPIVQGQLVGWYTRYSNRLAVAYDPEIDRSVYRNLGQVDKYGIDGSIAVQPMSELMLYAFGSYLKSEIKDDVLTGSGVIPTAGKREAGAPSLSYGVQARGFLGPVEVGATAKRTGGRYLYDTNEPLVLGGTEVYPAKTPAYWLVNLDVRLNLDWAGFDERTYFQFNVYNLFDELYVGSFNTSLSPGTSAPNAQIGAPRTVSATLNVAF